MEYFDVEHAQNGLMSFPRRRCGDVVGQRAVIFIFVSFSAFFVLYALVNPSMLGESPGSSSESTSPGHLRRMGTSEDQQGRFVDSVDTSLRGFVLAWNEPRGFLLLKCDRKRDKGLHYQLPGGHVKPSEDVKAAVAEREAAAATSQQGGTSAGVHTSGGATNTASSEVLSAEDVARVTAARELWEETGIDVRDDTQRLISLSSLGVGPLKKSRYYFFLNLTDSLVHDAVKNASAGAAKATHSTAHAPRTGAFAAAESQPLQLPEVAALGRPGSSQRNKEKGPKQGIHSASRDVAAPKRVYMCAEGTAVHGSTSREMSPAHSGAPLLLPIDTAEHSGFRFEADPKTAAKLVEKHSGGCSSAALLQFREAVVRTSSDVLGARGIPVVFK